MSDSATKSNSVHPSQMGENDAFKLFKRNAKKRTSRDITRMRIISNRVPDETMDIQDTILNIDTSVLLFLIGCFKLLLLTPLLVLGIVLISIKSSGKGQVESEDNSTVNNDITASSALSSSYGPTTSSSITSNPFYENLYKLRNDSVAPIWTAVMLAGSTAMDFVTACQRAGNTIIIYMLVTTVAFVACILCIEYDRIEINSICVLIENGFESLELHRKLYSACVAFASFGFVITFLSIYVGSKMAELEQHRLYMERDGLPAVLTKKDGSMRRFILSIAKRFQMICYTDVDPAVDSTIADVDSGAGPNENANDDRHVSWSNTSNKDV